MTNALTNALTDEMMPFMALIKTRAGLMFEGGGEHTLAMAVRRQHRDAGTATLAEYYSRLYCDAGEFKALVNLLTVNETYFFREPDQISLLTEHLLPRLLAERNTATPIRILSAGCSSGEEPYSLAMALQESYGESATRLFSLSGADIDGAMLAKARSGRYSAFSLRGAPDGIGTRYFDQRDKTHVLKDSIRRRVTFHEFNLLAAVAPPSLREFDIIFFRNVSIYFDAPTRLLIQHKLSAMMKPDSYLMIGTAETLANDFGVLQLVEEAQLYYFVKGKPPLAAEPKRKSEASPEVASPGSNTKSTTSVGLKPDLRKPAPTFDQLRELVRQKRFDEALAPLDSLLAANALTTEVLLLKGYICLHRQDYLAASELAQRALAVAEWSTDAFLLLGLSAKWRADVAEATRWFKQAVYASHECWPAHFYLAELCRASNEQAQAQRAYRVVWQMLTSEMTQARPPETGIKVIPLDLPASEVRFLCEHQLARLGDVRFSVGVADPR